MGELVPLRNASDTYVSEKYPSRNFGTAQRLYLADGAAANTRYGYIYFGIPSGMAGTTVLSARLILYSGMGFGGAVTLSIQRLAGKFSVNRVNWNNRPGVTGAVKNLSKTDAPAGTAWEYDVKPEMQQVADGAAWYGFRISVSGSSGKWLYSAQGLTQYRPLLEITWSDAPDTPEVLIPDNGLAVSVSNPTLRWDFVDPSGDQTLQSANLRLFSTQALADANGPGDVHDVSVPTTIPEFDLDTVLSRTASVTTTSTSTTITAGAGTFSSKDVNETISGAGIPVGATITAVASGTSATISAAATASGTITATIGVSYPGLALDASIWWRAQNIDGAGIPSGWSDPANFVRKSKGTLTITNPAAAPNDFVNEATPPFSWTFTGRTQEVYELILTTPETPEKRLWSTGLVTSTATAVTPPSGKIVEVGKRYRLIVRVYDTVDRASIPDEPVYVEASRDFTFSLSATVGSVTGLTGTPDTYRSRMTLDWTDATAPDSYVLFRDGKQYDEVFPVDVLVSGTSYRYRDDGARPRRTHSWSVGRKVNGVVSSANPSVNGIVKPITTTLSETNNNRLIYLFNPSVVAERAEESSIHYLLGDAPPVLVTQSHRGYEGQVSGVLLNDTIPGVTAEQQLTDLEWFKDHPGVVLKLVWIDKVMKVVVFSVTDTPLAHPDGTVEYLVSLEFFQVDI